MLRVNQRMRRLIDSLGGTATKWQVPDQWERARTNGIGWNGDVIWLPDLNLREPFNPKGDKDWTGYECSLTDTPLVWWPEQGATDQECLRRVLLLNEILHRAAPSELVEQIRVIAGINGEHSTFRFHLDRPGQSWLAEDLEGYEESAVGTWLLSDPVR